MRLLAWVARCTPFLATLFLAILTILALAVYPYGSNNQNGHSDGTATAAQVFLSTYMVALHILALVFPLRLYRAISDLVAHLERTSTGRLADIMSLQAKERASESDRVIFAIILPSYKEELSTLMDTLKVLAAHPGSETTYDVSGSNHRIALAMTYQRLIGLPCHRGEGGGSYIQGVCAD